MEEPNPLPEDRVRRELTAALERAASLPQPGPGPVSPEAPAEVVPSRPITFNAAMVRAILAGNKNQTRRPIRPAPAGAGVRRGRPWPTDDQGTFLRCRLASVGDRLWVREPWSPVSEGRRRVEYESDFGPAAAEQRRPWRPGRFLPREASRLTLEVRSVYPQRLGDLTPQDAIAEGMPPTLLEDDPAAAVQRFARLWDDFYGPGEFAWGSNPWVWVVRFKAIDPEEAR